MEGIWSSNSKNRIKYYQNLPKAIARFGGRLKGNKKNKKILNSLLLSSSVSSEKSHINPLQYFFRYLNVES